MAPILCSVARVRAGLATVVEMVGGPARMELDVIARPQSMHRPYKVRIPIAIRSKVYEFLAQQPQFPHLPGKAESLVLTYAQAEQLVLIALKAAEQQAAIEFSHVTTAA